MLAFWVNIDTVYSNFCSIESCIVYTFNNGISCRMGFRQKSNDDLITEDNSASYHDAIPKHNIMSKT